MLTKLDCSIKNFTHIIHVADIHIRLNSRQQEYINVFDKFYAEIDKSPKETLVCLLGDLFHSKNDLQPEAIDLCHKFLTNCANRRSTILIAGNHDAVLNNRSRLDSLTPVVDALNHSNLFYLKNSGLYGIGDILVSVCSVFDPENFVSYKNIPRYYINEYKYFISLAHAPIDKCLTDLGFRIDNRMVKAEMFDGYDICLAGDIHKAQDIFIEKEIEESELNDYLNTGDWEIVKDS